jgi:hypothetical protein
MIVKLNIGPHGIYVVAVRSMRDDDTYDVVFKAGSRAECEDYVSDVDFRHLRLTTVGRG